MTTTTLEAPGTPTQARPSPASGVSRASDAGAAPLPVASDAIGVGALYDKVRNDAWLWSKLFILALCASPAAFAIGWALRNESAGVVLAIIPDMLAAGGCLMGLLGCTLFFDDEGHA